MYHRNKVNTDEFWKYELVKNRFSEIDASVKEVLWQKQLGRHLEEAGPNAKIEVVDNSATEYKQEVASMPVDNVDMLATSDDLPVDNELVIADDDCQVEEDQVMDFSEQVEIGNAANDNLVNQNVCILTQSNINNNNNNIVDHNQKDLAMEEDDTSSRLSVQTFSSSSHQHHGVNTPRDLSIDGITPPPAVAKHETASDAVAIDYSVRKSSASNEGSDYHSSRSSISENKSSSTGRNSELIRMLVSGRVSVDSNNNNSNVRLRVDSPFQRIRSPATSRQSSPTPPASIEPSPPQSARSTPQSHVRPAAGRSSTPMEEKDEGSNSSFRSRSSNSSSSSRSRSSNSTSSTGSSGGDNSLLKALLLKNTDSSPNSKQAPAFFTLPEKNNILRKRLLGICDEESEQPAAKMTPAEDHGKISEDTSDKTTTVEEENVKSKVLTEDDYKHRSVLKILLYRYNTSHHQL